jgi:O-methyltransferase involved in polyketide biosynthesis
VDRPSWAPDEVDLDRPSVARVYDHYLGGCHHFAADRAFAEQAVRYMPELPRIAQGNRAFLHRSVRYLVAQGIRQFVDLGSGIPTVGNVHEVAQAQDATVAVVYVDSDPVAVAHSRALLTDNLYTAVVAADLRRPDDVLGDPATDKLIDLSEPVAFLFNAVLHFVPDEQQPAAVVARYVAAAAPGSAVTVSHAGSAPGVSNRVNDLVTLYKRAPTPLVMRSAEEVRTLLGDLTVVEPGVVPPALWRPDPSDRDIDPAHLLGSCAVGRKD